MLRCQNANFHPMTGFYSFHLVQTTVLGYFLVLGMTGFAQTKNERTDTLQEQFVDLGYHKLFARITGNQQAKFTVVFESGAGGSSKDWEKVSHFLPADLKVLTYDRAGLGKSEAGPLPRSMEQEVFELHQLLKSLNIKGPIVLVGQSMGGLLARLFTEKYGKNVVGLVLVDPTHESSVLGSMKYGGWVRLREKATGKPIPKPQVSTKESWGYDANADYMAEEFQKIYLGSSKKNQALGNRPLVVIGAGKRNQPPGTPDEQWKELRTERDQQIQELTQLSSNSKFILDPKSGHLIHYDNPEMVAQAIEMVTQAIISKTKL